jgi:hypothetical protein
LERDHKLLSHFSKLLPDYRNPKYITYSREQQHKQRVFILLLGYEDTIDATHLQNDPLFKEVLQGDLASQPTISGFENSFDKAAIFKLSYARIERYVSSLKGRNKVIIDADTTDDSTYKEQQLSMFNGYYGKFILNELFFHDGKTG